MTSPPSAPRHARSVYLALLLIQIAGAGCIIWAALPIFQSLAVSPGEQVLRQSGDYIVICASMAAMQSAYWYGFLRVPVPFAGPNAVLNHIVAFIGRLSFIFGAALFSVVFFRHLPVLEPAIRIVPFVGQGVLLVCVLFSLFCLSLELERLAAAIAPKIRS